MGAKRKYVVTLREEEREYLKRLIQKGKVSGFRIRHAQILLKLDEFPENKCWTGEKIAQAYSSNPVSMFEPLSAKRFVEVTDTRTRVDFAHCVKELADVHYPNAEKILLVMDHLNTHSIASLYQAFPAVEARRLAEKLEIHHTPKHASWLNMRLISPPCKWE